MAKEKTSIKEIMTGIAVKVLVTGLGLFILGMIIMGGIVLFNTEYLLQKILICFGIIMLTAMEVIFCCFIHEVWSQ